MNEPNRPRDLGGVFLDERIDVTGKSFVNASFDGCIVERRQTAEGEPQTVLYQCVFNRCEFIGDGWPGYWMKANAQ